MPPEPDTTIAIPPPIMPLIERVKLLVKVDANYALVYTALMCARNDNYTGQFLDEFSQANTLEQQAAVLEKWLALV